MMRKLIIFMFSLLIVCSAQQNTYAETFDHSKFDQILKQYVDDKGLVDYNGIAKDPRFRCAGVATNDRERAFLLVPPPACTVDDDRARGPGRQPTARRVHACRRHRQHR